MAGVRSGSPRWWRSTRELWLHTEMPLREEPGAPRSGAAGWTAKAVDKVVDKVLNDAAQVIADAVETAGNRAQDALDHLAHANRGGPLLGGALGGALGRGLRWLGGVASGAGDLVGAVVVGLGSVIAGVMGGTLRVIEGSVRGQGRLIRSGLVDMVSGLLGAVLVAAGKAISLLQSSLGIEAHKRRLSNDEIRILKQVFRESLAIYEIRIIAGRSGVFQFNDRPFTLGNTIYMKDTGAGDWRHTLVHESTHVWQYQHIGSRYASDALGAQLVLGGDVAYDWQKALPRRWGDFNKEAQAQILEDIYRFAGLAGSDPAGEGAFFEADGAGRTGAFVVPPAVRPAHMTEQDRRDLAYLTAGDFTDLAMDAVATVRRVRTVRYSRLMPRDVP
jgi:hypothetical protein